MSDDLRDRVRQVLEEAEERSASSDDDESAAESFGDVPERANELVEDADPAELLDAVSSEDLSVEESPETMADAMERADSETLLELRKLLTLSRMAREEDEEARDEHVETFRELSREGDAAEADEPEGPDEGEGDGADDASPDEAGDEQSAPDEEEEESDGDDRLREALLGEVDGFRERIQTARSELGDESEGESEGEAEASEDSEADEEETEADESGGGRESSGKDGTMFSTIPSRDRSDMRGPDRFSTVRKK